MLARSLITHTYLHKRPDTFVLTCINIHHNAGNVAFLLEKGPGDGALKWQAEAILHAEWLFQSGSGYAWFIRQAERERQRTRLLWSIFYIFF